MFKIRNSCYHTYYFV